MEVNGGVRGGERDRVERRDFEWQRGAPRGKKEEKLRERGGEEVREKGDKRPKEDLCLQRSPAVA